ncbi:family 3 adenylate cyclase [Synechococcus sp. PCC 7502]|uniref:adenylate/guanylate cyclase domain-containing protein n=1 Tax=Synechococcus sp. PCC 7502 TaxID=1173263 RepID=UPI00029F85E5|nr:adenylate/guanylate cyclase domain-containing protein [Synechococcus sp. PCC 7502]AFY72817.1 family 3 adenylate cyclase [Synechococcus sp. PCC 7502]
MPQINCLPDKQFVEISDSDTTVLAALLAGGIDHTHVCGGNAYCSTCRIMILDGIQNCSAPTSAERALAKKLDFPVHIRLACQTRVSGDVAIRRMVIDNEDIDIVEGQLAHGAIANDRPVVMLVASIRGATNFDEVNFHYDILYIMSRYFNTMQKVVGDYGGVISNYMGVKMLAIFGISEIDTPVERAVWAGLDMLKALADLNTYLEQLSYRPLQMSIGIHYGTTVLVPVDVNKPEILIPLGDAANLVGRVESANREVGSELLVTEAVYELIKEKAVINRSGTINFATGASSTSAKNFNVYEIIKMQGEPPKKVKKAEETTTRTNKIFGFIQKFSNSWRKPKP